jgi:hypothetical protein
LLFFLQFYSIDSNKKFDLENDEDCKNKPKRKESVREREREREKRGEKKKKFLSNTI